MCVNPRIMWKKSRDGSLKRIEFGCGKCSECVSKKHSAFALEASLEARRAKSLHMVTLTYNNDSVPIMVCSKTYRSGVLYEKNDYFLAKGSAYRSVAGSCLSINMDGSKSMSCRSFVKRSSSCKFSRYDGADCDFSEVSYTPSLRREDVRLWIKKCRVMYKRLYAFDMPGRYVFFGEYGDQTNRPHYHGLLYDFPDNAIQLLKKEWEKSFGFTLFEAVPALNSDGSPARVKVANYVSKYIAKDHKYKAVEDVLVEAPRRFCSRGFGTKCLSAQDVQSFKNFYQCKDLDRRNIGNKVFFEEYLKRNKTFLLEGNSFAFSRKLIELIHYESNKCYTDRGWIRRPCEDFRRRLEGSGFKERSSVLSSFSPRANALRRLALAYSRSRDTEAFDGQLRKNPEGYSVSRDRLSLLQACETERIAAKDRHSLAKKIVLNSLTKEKYK